MATPRKRGGDPAMEKLMAEALALEKARTAEQAGLLQMDKEEERRERELQMEARRRYEMDQQRKRHEEEEDRYHELMDQAHEKQLKTTARLKARQKEQAAAVKEKRDKYQAKMDAIAKARSDKLEAEMKKAKEIEQKSSTPRRGQSPRRLGTPGSGRRPGTSPRGTSPRRRVDLGASTDSLASTQRQEMMATRRLEEEKQALMKRAQPTSALLLSCSSLHSELTVVVFRAVRDRAGEGADRADPAGEAGAQGQSPAAPRPPLNRRPPRHGSRRRPLAELAWDGQCGRRGGGGAGGFQG